MSRELTQREVHQRAELRQHVLSYVPMGPLCDSCWTMPCACPAPPRPSLWRRLVGRA